MTFRLNLDDLPKSFSALARRETKRLAKLSARLATLGAAPAAADEAVIVHSTRKRVKRLRALLLLAETADTKAALRCLDRQLRDYGRQLGPWRDTAVLAATIARLAAGHLIGPKATTTVTRSPVTLARLSAMLAADSDDLERPAALAVDPLSVECLAALRQLTFADVTPASVVAAASRTYVRARRDRRVAEQLATSEAFHDWRKQVQRHARHLQLLADLWPAELAARVDAAKRLSACLGDEHDLYHLNLMLDRRSVPRPQRQSVGRLRATILDRQAELRVTSLTIADRLFAERGRAFRARLAAYQFERAEPDTARPKGDS